MRSPLIIATALAAALAGALTGCIEAPVAPVGPSVSPFRPAAASVDAKADDAAQRVLAYAAAQVGRPYCWGGTGPRCFDCSGLALMAWRQAGVALPRSADDVPKKLSSIPLTEVRPGDILWWPGHVGLYAGNGWSVEALDSRSGVVFRRAPKPHGAFRPRLPASVEPLRFAAR
jgi:cell wall-associated NlpC family hydrolase